MLMTLHLYSFLLALASFSSLRRYTPSLSLFVASFAILFAGISYDVGKDYFGYLTIYDSVPTFSDALSFESFFSPYFQIHGELGFLVLNSLLKEIASSHNVVYFINSTFSFSIIFYLSLRHSRNTALALFIYMSLFFLNYNFAQIRLGLSASIVLMSLSFLARSSYFTFLFCILTAATFHKLALFALPLVLLRSLYSLKVVVGLVFLGAVLHYFKPISLVLSVVLGLDVHAVDQLAHYSEKDKYSDVAFPYFAFVIRFSLLLGLLIIYSRCNVRDSFVELALLTFGLGLFYWLSFWEVSILAGRLNQMFAMVLILLVPRMVYLSKSKTLTSLMLGCFLAYCLVSFYKMIFNLENNFVPFKTILFF